MDGAGRARPVPAGLPAESLAGEGLRVEGAEPVVERHLADLAEAPADDALGSFVVEDQVAALVGDECRRGQVGGELPREDEDEMLLPLRVHALAAEGDDRDGDSQNGEHDPDDPRPDEEQDDPRDERDQPCDECTAVSHGS